MAGFRVCMWPCHLCCCVVAQNQSVQLYMFEEGMCAAVQSKACISPPTGLSARRQTSGDFATNGFCQAAGRCLLRSMLLLDPTVWLRENAQEVLEVVERECT